MDVLDFINNGGQKTIPNPNYNPKSKKNIQPPTITVDDLDPEKNSAVNMAVQDFLRQYSIGSKEADLYRKEGLNWNPWENLDKQMAEQQGALSKFGNALAQTVVSEIGYGTFIGIADLFDMIGQAVGLSDPNYQNPASKYLTEKQEEFKEATKIWTDPDVNIANGGLTDAGWWASNIPSIASSLTLLIPSTGIVKGLSWVGKARNVSRFTRNAVRVLSGAERRLKYARELKAAGATAETIQAASKLTKMQRFLNSSSTISATNLFLENGMTAALSRAMENYQEARQTYNDMYANASEAFKTMSDEEYAKVVERSKDIISANGIDSNDRDAVAKVIAKESADKTFQIDWLNVGWDVLQMYGLRNAWKGLKNAPSTSASIRRTNLDAAKYFGKSAEEVAKLKSQRTLKEKFGEKLSDFMYGSKLTIGAQLSEGAEEALNYIAQQEGITFGKVLLGQEQKSNFDTRLSKYIQTPEIYDSAFWGVMGGVVFQGLGSQFRRLSNKLTEDKRANDEAKKSLPWYKLDELPELKRSKGTIEANVIDFDIYATHLKKIKEDDIDIYYPNIDGTERKFETDFEKLAAEKKLKHEAIAKMTIRAMNNGTLDMFKEFMANDNVRKGMIARGMFGKVSETRSEQDIENESKAYIEDALRLIDKIEEQYDEEISALDSAAAVINSGILSDEDERSGRKKRLKSTALDTIPVEYLQIMAVENVKARIEIDNLRTEEAATEQRINDILNTDGIKENLDENVPYRNSIKLSVITRELGRLRAERARLMQDESKNLSNTLAIENIDKNIASLENQLDDAELVYATGIALQFVSDGNGKYHQEVTSESVAYQDAMITRSIGKELGEVLNIPGLEYLSARSRTTLGDEKIAQEKIKDQNVQSAISTLKNVSPELLSTYQEIAAIQTRLDFANNDIVRTIDQVKHQAAILNNTMNEARKTAIIGANKILLDMYRKYGDRVLDAIYDKYHIKGSDTQFDRTTANMTSEEKQNLSDAIDVLDLTNDSNKALFDVLLERFKLEDAIRASREEETDNEESQSSVIIGGTISDTENAEVDNSSSGTAETVSNQENEQIDGVGTPIDPQQTENRTPIYYTKFYGDKKGNFTSGRHANTDEDSSSIAVYDNEDGTFTLDVRGNKQNLNDTRFFSNANEVDLTRPFKVERKPIAIRNKKGKFVISEQGRLVNTDTLEYQQQQEEKAIQEQAQQEGSQEVQNGKTSNTQAAPTTTESTSATEIPASTPSKESSTSITQPTTSSTGEQKSNSTSKTKSFEEVVNQAPAGDEINNEALGKFMAAARANHDIDLDYMANQLISEYVAKGADRAIAESAVTKAKNIIQRKLDRLKANNNETTMRSSIDEVLIAQSTITEVISDSEEVKAYKEAVKQMIAQYAKEVGLEELNGKLYINLEDLLRYTNTSTNDKTISAALFESMKQWLSTFEAKEKYIVTDEAETNKANFIENTQKTAEERYLERLADVSVQRVDIQTYVSNLTDPNDVNTFYDALDALQPGMSLATKVVGNVVHVLDGQNRVVGTMPIPRVNSTTGAYEMYNDGWKTDIDISNGSTKSALKDLFTQWLTSKDDSIKQLNAIIFQLAYTNPDDTTKTELYSQLENNSAWKIAKSKGFMADNANTEKLVNGLVKLWKFAKPSSNAPISMQNNQIKRSINAWFDKLKHSYNAVSALSKGGSLNISVATISDGELIRAEENKAKAEANALPADKAIAGGVNPDIHKIAVSDSIVVGQLNVAGAPNLMFKGVTKGGYTFVILPNRSGRPGYVHAYPVEVTADYIGQDAKDILKTVHNEITKLLNEYNNDKTTDNYNKLKTFFKQLLYNKDGNRSLFDSVVYSETNNGFSISIPGTNMYIKFHETGRYGGPAVYAFIGEDNKNIPYDKPRLHQAVNNIINNMKFKLSYAYIAGDNVLDQPMLGFANRINGKFEINIGEKSWVYNSFNEFILNNNLVRLNTKPASDGRSNYERRGQRSQAANQVFEIKITKATTSPVEENIQQQVDPTPAIQRISTLSIPDKAMNILNGTTPTTNKGLAIAELHFDKNTLKILENLDILPKSITFDPEYNNRPGNKDYNAEVNPRTGEVTIGQKWVDMFNDPRTRVQAIRKLIHEQLHYKLHNKRSYVRSAKEIYNEFKAALDAEGVPADGHMRAYLFEHLPEDEALEEFLVETLTSQELADKLNSIDAQGYDKKSSRNLLQKVLELMSKVFGWGVRKGSLYEKELYTLRQNFKDAIENKTSTEDNTSQDNDVTNNAKENQTETNTTTQAQVSTRTVVYPTTTSQPSQFGTYTRRRTRGKFKSSITEISNNDSNYSNEMQTIKEQTIADGTFMKAPNGKPTNLTERQWLQVRTKAFKKWFGDWEKAIIQNKYEPITSNPKFKHSLFRGQSSVPEIDADGNLYLKTKYDSLSKLKTLSFASVKNEALHYGYRVAKNPYIIEVNEDYLDNILPKEEYEKEKVESKKPFRYNEEFNEVRLSFNDEIIIPKEQYNITHNATTINITDLNSAIAEILSLNELRFKSDSQEYTGISELEGAISSQDIKEYDDKIIDILGEKYYNIIAVSELSKNQRLQHYIPVKYNTIKNYINEGYLIEKDYDSFTEKELKTLPLEVIEQIKKELSYYELTYKAKKEIDNAIKSNKTKDNVSKVVDENGEPLVVYHGNTDTNITKFVPNKGKYSNKPLYYFSNSKDTALSYATEGASTEDPNDYTIVGFNVAPNTEEAKYADFKSLEDFDIATRSKGRIYEVFLNIRNPINNVSPAYIHDNSLLKGKNNDGMISIPFSDRVKGVEDRVSKDIQYVVLSSNQIKSATDNIGTFSTTDNDIRHSSITEHTAKIASISTFTDRLPVPQQAKFATMVGQGDVKVSCM